MHHRLTRSRLIPAKLRIESLEDRSVPAVVFGEDFESTPAGGLPPGWTALNNIGAAPLWNVDISSPPTPAAFNGSKSVWIDDPGSLSDKLLTSPAISLPNTAGLQLRFRHNYSLESSYDGGVLEISVNGAAFQDILASGATFVSGAYPTTTISTGFSSAIGGRRAWTGSSAGWQTVLINLPAAVQGQSVQFRWRMASDTIVGATGWRVDSVKVATPSPPIFAAASGNNQSARVDEPYLGALSVRVLDQFDEGLAGRTVTFTAPTSGASVVFTSPTTVVTDANGLATVTVTANGTAGAVTVTASSTGFTAIPFSLTNLPNLPPENVSAGGPYIAASGDTIVFTATGSDPEGRPVTYSWDVNGDGVFGDFLGQRLNLTSIQLTAFGITTGFSTNNVKVRVSDGRNTVDSPATSLAVNVFVPTVPPGGVLPPVITNVVQLTALAAGAGGGPHVQVFNADGSTRFAFFAYDTGFRGGISVATGDVTGDGVEDVVTGAGPGGGPHVKVYDGVSGAEVRSFFAFTPIFSNGVSIATGDVNGDGKADVVVGAGPGGGPHVKVFDGATGAELRSFFAFNSGFRGGVNVAAGDVNGDGQADVVVGAGAGGGPNVKVFDGRSMAVIRDFFAFNVGFSGGVTVAAGDLNADGKAELMIGQASGGSTVTVIDGDTGVGMLSYTMTGATGVRVALSDVTGDGRLDPLVASGPGSRSVLRVLNTSGSVLREISPFGGFGGGVFVG